MYNTAESIDQIIDDAAYVNADAILIQITSQYIETARDISKRSWDTRANNNYNSMPILEYFIQQAHAKGIQIHSWSSINIVNNTKDAEYKLFGSSARYIYNTVRSDGTTKYGVV